MEWCGRDLVKMRNSLNVAETIAECRRDSGSINLYKTTQKSTETMLLNRSVILIATFSELQED